MLCLISELTLLGLSCECFTVSRPSGGLDGSVNGGAGTQVRMGGGSSSRKLGFVTSVDVETEKLSKQVTRISTVINYNYYPAKHTFFPLSVANK